MLRINVIKASIFILWVIMGGFSFGVLAQDKDSTPDSLARVAILPFEDNTETADFEYMPQSLVDAIDKSMRKNFEYISINQSIVKSSYDNIVNYKKIKSKKDQNKALAENMKADIIIYGSFKFDKNSQEIVISATVYLAGAEAERSVPDTRNKVDSTIFQATDKVAVALVAEINVLVEEFRKSTQAKNKSSDEKSEEPDKTTQNKKTKLTRALSETSPYWENKGIGTAIGVELSEYQTAYSVTNFGVHWHSWVTIAQGVAKGNIFLSMNLEYSEYYNGPDLYAVNTYGDGYYRMFGIVGSLGYRYPMKSMAFFIEAGGGYYTGSYDVDYNSLKKTTDMSDYMIKMRTGLEFMMDKSVYGAFVLNTTLYNASPNAIVTYGIGFLIGRAI